jgi:hypothetical protein
VGSVTFRTDTASARARRLVVQPGVRDLTARLAAAAASNSPRVTGRLAAGWKVVPGSDPGTSLVVNDVPYARFVEYGTRRRRPAAPLGRAVAAGGGR